MKPTVNEDALTIAMAMKACRKEKMQGEIWTTEDDHNKSGWRAAMLQMEAPILH